MNKHGKLDKLGNIRKTWRVTMVTIDEKQGQTEREDECARHKHSTA